MKYSHRLFSSSLLSAMMVVSLTFPTFAATTASGARAKRVSAQAQWDAANSLAVTLHVQDVRDCYGLDRVRAAELQLKTAFHFLAQGDAEVRNGADDQSLTFYQQALANAQTANGLLAQAQRRGGFVPPADHCSMATRDGWHDTLLIGIHTDKMLYHIGEAVNVTLTVTNITSDTISLNLSNGCEVGLMADWGQKLTNPCQTGTNPLTLAPGQSFRWNLVYDQGLAWGPHSITASVWGYGNETQYIQVIP